MAESQVGMYSSTVLALALAEGRALSTIALTSAFLSAFLSALALAFLFTLITASRRRALQVLAGVMLTLSKQGTNMSKEWHMPVVTR